VFDVFKDMEQDTIHVLKHCHTRSCRLNMMLKYGYRTKHEIHQYMKFLIKALSGLFT